jgi:demethylmenaquinone methyltransferase/2-methoxy-6-polyprenyl-1,4-benzoquinol methylase
MHDTDPAAKARAVREMFGAIAGRYDFLNHFLSLNVDRHWRRVCVRAVEKKLHGKQARILDVGCGTGDLSRAFARMGTVVGCDFCLPMLRIAAAKASRNRQSVALLEGDALTLPFADSVFNVVATAFVLRNLSDIDRGLREMQRVLEPGGILAILDFSLPKVPLLGPLYRAYFGRVLPAVGRLISGVDGPYSYLPESVKSFPARDELVARVAAAGFSRPGYRRLTGGVAFLLLADCEKEPGAVRADRNF